MKHKIMTRTSMLSRIIPALVLLSLIALLPDASMADSPEWGVTGAGITTQSCNLLFTIKGWLFKVVYILGAIGLVIIAVSAFLGRFKFAHLIALGGGLFIVAAADLLISFMTAGTGAVGC